MGKVVKQESERERIERQIENILVARAMMDSLPDSAIYPKLGDWKSGDLHKCGSSACFGGWCAVNPHFNKQGVKMGEEEGWPVLVDQEWPHETAAHLFGSENVGDGTYVFGEHRVFRPGRTTDREEINWRLDSLLEQRLEELERVERVETARKV